MIGKICGLFRLVCWFFGLMLTYPGLTSAMTNYCVATNGLDTNPGTNWSAPLQTISNAVGMSIAGDIITVSNGSYDITTQIIIDKGITVRAASANPAETIINGQGLCRVFYLNHVDAMVAGLTITNGYGAAGYPGAGIRVQAGCVSNCMVTGCRCLDTSVGGGGLYMGTSNSYAHAVDIIGNYATNFGGGVYAYAGRLINCRVGYNTMSGLYGAGIFIQQGLIRGCTINNNSNSASGNCTGSGIQRHNSLPGSVCEILDCVIVSNSAGTLSGVGGGINLNGGVVSNCFIAYNTALYGGGVYATRDATLNMPPLIVNCIIQSNYFRGFFLGANCEVRGCLVSGNWTSNAPGYYGGGLQIYNTTGNIVRSCTFVDNFAYNGGGMRITTASNNVFENCIIYSNRTTLTTYPDYYCTAASDSNVVSHCCVSSTNGLLAGVGNTTNNPQMVDITGGNCRLQRLSPCVNAGLNQAWMADALDLDGNSRLDRFGRRVDMGCYEYVFQGTLFGLH